jgi:hypothetical protein
VDGFQPPPGTAISPATGIRLQHINVAASGDLFCTSCIANCLQYSKRHAAGKTFLRAGNSCFRDLIPRSAGKFPFLHPHSSYPTVTDLRLSSRTGLRLRLRNTRDGHGAYPQFQHHRPY